eukprot:CAMPEP_0181477560 /NCGR_PEP_ID=MMETSP1110-20121109/42278_1 /TAXON_ID=174948 /ORGANISM="Symbiodinium sp., Strain CCMP421" /LENGTH=56 /DNA_ID=CAMNT_0023602863 /DNA_START=702 /DNA_END=872 /DNA_ORIENTATION=-
MTMPMIAAIAAMALVLRAFAGNSSFSIIGLSTLPSSAIAKASGSSCCLLQPGVFSA